MTKSLFWNNPENLMSQYLTDVGNLFELEAQQANKEVDGKDTPYVDEGADKGYKCIHSRPHDFF